MILEAQGIRKLYGAYVALDGVNLSIREGEFVSIIGPNGAGKSTLINVLTGGLAPSGGAVRFKGKDIGGIGPVALARLGMARSFQLVQIFPELTVLETLQAAAVSRLGRGARLFASLRGDRQVQAEALEVFRQTFVPSDAGAGSEAGVGQGAPRDPVKPDVGWDRLSSADDEDDDEDGPPGSGG